MQNLLENELALKNITNKNLKDIFDVVFKTLQYVEYKHLNENSENNYEIEVKVEV